MSMIKSEQKLEYEIQCYSKLIIIAIEVYWKLIRYRDDISKNILFEIILF